MLRILLAVVTAIGLSSAFAGALEEKIAQRLAPVGSVCIEGQECDAANGAAVAVADAGGARSGEDVYNAACSACHGAGVAGAPKFADAGAWADRIGKGIDSLYSNAINGINGMPPKGMCMDCSDDEIKAAVDYIADNSQ